MKWDELSAKTKLYQGERRRSARFESDTRSGCQYSNGRYRTSTPILSKYLSDSETSSECDVSESDETDYLCDYDKGVDRKFMKKFRSLTLDQQFKESVGRVCVYKKKLVEGWSVRSVVYDGVLGKSVSYLAEYLKVVKLEAGLTLLYDVRSVLNSGGRKDLVSIWEWLDNMDLRRGVKRKVCDCMCNIAVAPTKFPKLIGWSLQMCRIVSGLNLKVFDDGNSIKYIMNWGSVNWLDIADNCIVGCLEAGEVMELLMLSDSFGSDSREGDGLKSLVNYEKQG